MTKYRYDDFLGVLEYLQERRDVFISGVDGRPTDPNSYMTVVEPPALRRAIEDSSSGISNGLWDATADFFESAPNWSPILKITAGLIKCYNKSA